MPKPIEIPFFGRRDELAELESRCAEPGLTIVKGPPKIGKTRLLKHFVKRSRAAGSRRIGIGQAAEAGGDVLLRAIKDAYEHWLTNEANAIGQLRAIHKQMKGKYISKVGTALGKALADFTGPGKGLVTALFSSLSKAQQMLETGGLQIPRLTSEEARDLLTILADGQAVPIVVILNQWEDGQDLDHDVATLQTFQNSMQTWPEVHIILHLRDPRFPEERNPEAARLAGTLANHPAASFLKVDRLDFETDQPSQERLTEWLQAHFPAIDSLEPKRLLDLIEGHPGVLEEWSYLSEADRSSFERLAEVAGHARAARSPEFWSIYEKLLQDVHDGAGRARLELAILAAILPLPPEAEAQRGLLPAILGDAPEAELVHLESMGLLRPENGVPLSLGHPSRREDAERCVLGVDPKRNATSGSLDERLRPYARAAVDRVIPALIDLHSADSWSRLAEETRPAAAAAAAAAPLVEITGASEASMLLCATTQGLFLASTTIDNPSSASVLQRKGSSSQRTAVCIGLSNAIADAGADTTRADELLAELRNLAQAHTDEAGVQTGLLSACGASMRAHRQHTSIVVARFNEATEVLCACPTDANTQRICVLILGDAKAAHAVVDEAGKREIDEVGRRFWQTYRAKWPD